MAEGAPRKCEAADCLDCNQPTHSTVYLEDKSLNLCPSSSTLPYLSLPFPFLLCPIIPLLPFVTFPFLSFSLLPFPLVSFPLLCFLLSCLLFFPALFFFSRPFSSAVLFIYFPSFPFLFFFPSPSPFPLVSPPQLCATCIRCERSSSSPEILPPDSSLRSGESRLHSNAHVQSNSHRFREETIFPLPLHLHSSAVSVVSFQVQRHITPPLALCDCGVFICAVLH